MDRLYLGDPNDAEVDALLSQLNDESLMKLKVNSHNTASSRGFEYPTFTDGWTNDDDDADLDNQLASRFSSLKLPIIISSKKKGRDSNSDPVGKKGRNPQSVLKKGRDSEAVHKKGRDSEGVGKKGRDSEVVGKKRRESEEVVGGKKGRDLEVVVEDKKGEEGEEEESSGRSNMSSSRSEEQQQPKTEIPRSLSQATEFLSCKSSDNDDDQDSIDALLNERFRALKASSAPAASSGRNVGLENLMQFSGQLSSNNDYEGYGSSLSIPSSPSAKLLGRSKSRSSPRVMTSSVSSSFHCSAPSPLKLLKQVSSKSFPSSKQLSGSGTLPPQAPRSPAGKSTPVKKAGREYKVEGFGNSKPQGKENEKKGKKEKKRSGSDENDNNNNPPSTVKDMRRMLSSVADRVGFERSRVSSAAEEDEFLGDDLHAWSVLEGDQEFAKVSTEEQKLNREAERVVEWAKDAARLEIGESGSEAEDLEPGEGDDNLQDSGGSSSSDGSSTRKEKSQTKEIVVVKAVPKKKKWGLF